MMAGVHRAFPPLATYPPTHHPPTHPSHQVIKLIEAVEDLKRQCGIPVSTAWAAWHGIGVVLSGLVGWHGMEFRHGIE